MRLWTAKNQCMSVWKSGQNTQEQYDFHETNFRLHDSTISGYQHIVWFDETFFIRMNSELYLLFVGGDNSSVIIITLLIHYLDHVCTYLTKIFFSVSKYSTGQVLPSSPKKKSVLEYWYLSVRNHFELSVVPHLWKPTKTILGAQNALVSNLNRWRQSKVHTAMFVVRDNKGKLVTCRPMRCLP